MSHLEAESTPELLGPAVPFPAETLFGEPGELTRLRATDGLPAVRTATGDSAWLVCRYADVKALARDDVVGRGHPDPPSAARLWDSALFEPEPGGAAESDDHARWRRAVSRPLSLPALSAGYQHRIDQILDRLLDEIVAAGPPADLCVRLIRPFAIEVIFDLLGVPEAYQAALLALGDEIRRQGDRGRSVEAYQQVRQLFRELVEQTPDDATGIMAQLRRHRDGDGPLTPDQASQAGTFLFLGGYETVATRLAHMLLFLLVHPGQAKRLREAPEQIPAAIEEMLRMIVPGGGWVPRYAQRDFAYAGSHVQAGDLIVFAIQSANRDEQAFPEAATFLADRTPNAHIAFGYGPRFCLGAALARLELRAAVREFLRRLPDARLAGPVEEIEFETEKSAGGIRRLPIIW